MEWVLGRAEVPELVVLESTGSTNTALAELAAARDLADFTTVLTTDQRSGRGRLGRAWTAPPGTALAISVLVPGDAGPWIPLAAGLAMARAAGDELGDRVRLKWPNDVLVGERKLCGILAEMLPGGRVVVGAGLNVGMTREQLPVPTATSLLVEGADPARADAVLAAYLAALRLALSLPAEGLRDAVRARCATIGRRVRVELPGGGELVGVAQDVDGSGRLEVRVPGEGVRAVSAGDIVHLRALA